MLVELITKKIDNFKQKYLKYFQTNSENIRDYQELLVNFKKSNFPDC